MHACRIILYILQNKRISCYAILRCFAYNEFHSEMCLKYTLYYFGIIAIFYRLNNLKYYFKAKYIAKYIKFIFLFLITQYLFNFVARRMIKYLILQ